MAADEDSKIFMAAIWRSGNLHHTWKCVKMDRIGTNSSSCSHSWVDHLTGTFFWWRCVLLPEIREVQWVKFLILFQKLKKGIISGSDCPNFCKSFQRIHEKVHFQLLSSCLHGVFMSSWCLHVFTSSSATILKYNSSSRLRLIDLSTLNQYSRR